MTKLSNTLADKVIHLLEEYPRLRDDWQYLLAMLWREQIGEDNHKVSCFNFFGKLANKEVFSPESVRRSWQKILEENPKLRGPGYKTRHKILEPEFKESVAELGEYIREAK